MSNIPVVEMGETGQKEGIRYGHSLSVIVTVAMLYVTSTYDVIITSLFT